MKISACTPVNSFGLGPHFGQQNEYISVKKMKRMDHVQSCQLFLEYRAFKIENNTWARVDMEFLFECCRAQRTSEMSS